MLSLMVIWIYLLRRICSGPNEKGSVNHMGEVSSCAKCGACSTVCPVYRVTGNEAHIARGKLHLIDVLGLGDSSESFIDIFSACLLCGACSAVCSRHIDIGLELVKARATFSSHAGPHGYEKYLMRKVLDSPTALKGLALLGQAGEKLLASRLPKDSGLRLRLALFAGEALPQDVKQEQSAPADMEKLVWFPGCTAQYLFPDTGTGCRSLMAEYGFSLVIPDGLACCGLASWTAGDTDTALKNGRNNIRALEKSGGDILVSCSSCFSHLQKYPELFAGDEKWAKRAQRMAARLQDMSAFIKSLPSAHATGDGERLCVFYHDPCHMRFDFPGVDKGRELLLESGRVKVLELADGPRCCGQGGLFHVAYPDISATIRDQLVKDVLALQPDIVTTSCSGCLMQWKQGLLAAGSEVRVIHLASLLQQLHCTA